MEKIRKDVVGSPSLFVTRKAFFHRSLIGKTTKTSKSIVWIDPSQLYPYSTCKPMPTGLHTRFDRNSETDRFTPCQNKTPGFANKTMSYFQRLRPNCEIESFRITDRQKKIEFFSVIGFFSNCITVLGAMSCFYPFFPVKRYSHLSLKKILNGPLIRELDAGRREFIQKGFAVIEMWECEWWRLYKTTTFVEQHCREEFPYRRLLTGYQFQEVIKNGKCLVMFYAILN